MTTFGQRALAARARASGPRGAGRLETQTRLVVAAASLFGVAGVLAAAACGGAPSPRLPTTDLPPATRSAPERPARCDTTATAGAALQPLIDTLPERGTLCLVSGDYVGPISITRSATLWGPADAVVLSRGVGTTIAVDGSDIQIMGFTIDGSGGRFDVLDAALHITGHDVRAEGLLVRNAVFGLLVEKASKITLKNNEIHGLTEGPIGQRGDPIRLWETRDSLVESNRVLAGRDVVVWYATHNRIIGNLVTDGRYGTHLMYSHDNVIEGNQLLNNVVGIFLMYSRDVVVRGNSIIGASGPAGMGLGMKECGNLTVAGNALLDNTIGLYLDTTPLQESDRDIFSNNLIGFGETAIVFHSSEDRNLFQDNSFRDNRAQVRVDGNGHARAVTWRGNHFDDYQGYDLDGDGVGDIPYELRSLSGELVQRKPELAFLTGTPALWMMDAVTHIAPLLAPPLILSDPTPRMVPAPLDYRAAALTKDWEARDAR
ncbi:MAG: nitrous oxide reductase family maturation protein NosD [Deltaproteobacteria bacterium]|nr:nitrous oxide reductase family maturation protein NosD [Deltaproteobacteria bacterium]